MGLDQESYQEWVTLRQTLLREECEELCEALAGGDPLKIAREMADVVYLVFGTAVRSGIDLHKAYQLVHEANMSKLVDGKPVMRADGKVLKGPNYRAPDMSLALAS